MIIGINGKIGSGKDTIGSIIQYLTSESGDPNSSRYRSYAEFLSKGGGYAPRNFDHHYVSDWEIKKFAGKLKTTASLLTGIPVEEFEDQEFKKTNLSNEWSIGYGKKLDGSYTDVSPMTVRELLQKLGTDAMRDNLHENVWVNALFADYRSEHKKDKQVTPVDVSFDKSTLPNWIITDTRFPNEMEAIEERGGITIRVVRENDIKVQRSGNSDDYVIEKFDKTNPKHVALKLAESSRLHPSETALDDAEFDYEIINDGTIEDLIEKVREILIRENIL